MFKILFIGVLSFILVVSCISYGQEVPYTQQDRERLVRVETKVEEGNKAINQRFDDFNKRLDDTNQRINDLREEMSALRTFMLWGFGILFGGIGGLITIVIWDRRTAISPVIRKNEALQEQERVVEKILREYAKVEPKFAEILKMMNF
jgi:hypothetical protein